MQSKVVIDNENILKDKVEVKDGDIVFVVLPPDNSNNYFMIAKVHITVDYDHHNQLVCNLLDLRSNKVWKIPFSANTPIYVATSYKTTGHQSILIDSVVDIKVIIDNMYR